MSHSKHRSRKKTGSRQQDRRQGSRLWLGIGAVAVVFIVAAGLFLSRGGEGGEGPEPGKLAPDWTMQEVSGGAITLSELRGEPQILVFYRFHT